MCEIEQSTEKVLDEVAKLVTYCEAVERRQEYRRKCVDLITEAWREIGEQDWYPSPAFLQSMMVKYPVEVVYESVCITARWIRDDSRKKKSYWHNYIHGVANSLVSQEVCK